MQSVKGMVMLNTEEKSLIDVTIELMPYSIAIFLAFLVKMVKKGFHSFGSDLSCLLCSVFMGYVTALALYDIEGSGVGMTGAIVAGMAYGGSTVLDAIMWRLKKEIKERDFDLPKKD